MTTIERLYKLCESYETFDYKYLLSIAKEKADYIYRMTRSRDGSEFAKNFLTIYSALLAQSGAPVSEKVYNFFVEATGFKDSLTYSEFVLLAKKSVTDLDFQILCSDYSKVHSLPKDFDNAMFLYAVVFIACDGKSKSSEIGAIINFVPFGDFSDV